MEFRDLGHSGLRVPVIGMGTWQTFDVFGKEDQAERRELVRQALDRNIRVFDSSPMYGEAERVLGAALVGQRKRAIVATKVWSTDVAEGHAQIDRALHYFDGTVDIYQVHNLVRWREYLKVFERMKAVGTVRAIGVTHYAHSAFPDLARVMRDVDIDVVQLPYNALDRLAERELLQLAAERGIGVVVMQPFGAGRLLAHEPPASALRPFAHYGCRTWAQVLLKWVLSDPRVTVAIPATREIGHMAENAAAGDPPWFGPAERAEIVSLARHYGGFAN
jgi:aryl-alcohol dehydrogenase-like predicted oxidoreductase